MAKYCNFNYLLGDWRNDHWVGMSPLLFGFQSQFHSIIWCPLAPILKGGHNDALDNLSPTVLKMFEYSFHSVLKPSKWFGVPLGKDWRNHHMYHYMYQCVLDLKINLGLGT